MPSPDPEATTTELLTIGQRQRLGSVVQLQHDEVLWITTSGEKGQPQSSPVWFHWDGEDFLLFSRPAATKVTNIARHPEVALHLNGGEPGSTVVSIEGTASIVDVSDGRRDQYIEKYRAAIARLGTDPQSYLADFSTAIAVRPTRARVFDSN